MSEVKQYDAFDGYGTPLDGKFVRHDDYAALAAECERLRAQVSALQSDANSWQSGYDKGREDGAKAAEGWKAQHARDSAELRRLCSERDEQWRIRRDVEADRDTANAISAELRAERDALAAELDQFSQANRELSEKNVRRREQVRQLRTELAAIKGQSGFDYSIRTQSTNSVRAAAGPAVDIGRNAAFEACPDTGCDWSSFYRGWNAALAAIAKESQQ